MRYIASLKQLEHLTIGEAVETVQIDHATFAIVAECTHLKSLRVGKFNWADEDVRAIAKLPNLLDLFIQGPGTDKPTFSDAREDCPEATDGKRLTDAGMRHIARMKTLNHLDVSLQVDLSDEFISELARNSKLEYLYVKSPLFTDKALETIRTKMDLNVLDIDSPQFSDGAIQKVNDGKKYRHLFINERILQRSP